MSLKSALAALLAAFVPRESTAAATAAALHVAAERWAQQAKSAIGLHAPVVAAAIAAESGAPVAAATLDRQLSAGVGAVVRGAQQQYGDAADDPAKQAVAVASLTWRARQMGITETQDVTKEAFKSAAQQRGARVLREEADNCCPLCAGLAGEYDANNADCWVTHPSCQGVWTIIGRADMNRADFATLSAAQRNKLDDSDFAGPNRTFPCHDQAHVDAAVKLVGRKSGALAERIKAGIKRIAKRKGLTLPDSWGTADHSADAADLDIATFLSLAPMLDVDALATELDEDDYPPAELFEDAVFARGGKGNEPTLIAYWTKRMASKRSGGGSDFNDCVTALTGKVKNPPGLCNWMHQRATGAPPGHAAGEKYANHSSADFAGGFAEVATFAGADGSGRYVDGAYAVYPKAMLWRAGEYSDKSYAMSREENVLAADAFSQPVPINMAHTPLLQGRAGELRSLFVDEADPDVLRGAVAVPLWLDEHMDDSDRRLSLSWNRETKTPEHLAFVTEGRVAGAALFAAAQEASRMNQTADMAARGMTHHTRSGQASVQALHDMAGSAGAVCKPPQPPPANYSADFASKHEANFFQQTHDGAVEHGAQCETNTSGGRAVFSATSPEEGRKMSLKDKFVSFFGGNLTAEEHAELDTVLSPKPATFSVSDDPQFRAMQDEVQRERGKRIEAEATQFADGLIGSGRATTAERTALIAKFSRAATDDFAHGTADFAGFSDTHSRVDELVAQEMSRPQQFPQARPVPGQSVVLNAYSSDPATFAGQTQLSEDEERKAAAERMRNTDAYKRLHAAAN